MVPPTPHPCRNETPPLPWHPPLPPLSFQVAGGYEGDPPTGSAPTTISSPLMVAEGGSPCSCRQEDGSQRDCLHWSEFTKSSCFLIGMRKFPDQKFMQPWTIFLNIYVSGFSDLLIIICTLPTCPSVSRTLIP